MTRHPFVSVLIASALTLGLSACSTKEAEKTEPMAKTLNLLTPLEQEAPVAGKKPFTAEYHGISLSDSWHWLRDPNYPNTDDPEILDYLKAENIYYDAFKEKHQGLIDTLFEEFKGRLDESETSVPWISNGYQYRWEYKEGDEYRTWYRQSLEAGEESVFLDEPALAADYDYFVVGARAISPDNRYLAYAIDTSGDERYQVFVKDLTTNELLPDVIEDNNGDVTFAADSQSLIYGLLEEDKWRTISVNVRTLGDTLGEDRVLISEMDDSFFLGFYKTLDGEYLVLTSGKGNADEAYVISADLSGEPVLLASRDQEFKFSVTHAHGKFYILANDTHVNSRLAVVSDQTPAYENWQTLIEGSDSHYLRNLATFDGFMAIKQNVNGLERLSIRDYEGSSFDIDFPESLYNVSFGNNPEFSQTHFRLGYESMITPETVYDFDIATKELTERKVTNIPSGYDKSQYETKRLMAKSRDGVLVPISIMYKKGTKLDGSNPLHLYGYGAYAYGLPPYFSSVRLSMVDRGVIYAFAHVRGGDEMGYQWYLDGKLDKRTNTFNDFVDAAHYLIDEGYTSAGNISASGASAGGELMGAVIIQAPELWSSVLLSVPFVDVLNTMLDASLPLTPPEWVEWGNPIEDKDAFVYMQSYSPYDQIMAKDYPAMMVTGGLNDPRVTYWEPAKWTAKMRDMKTDNNLLIMRMNMGAGHFANSGRYGRLMDYAEEYAFSLLSHGIDQ